MISLQLLARIGSNFVTMFSEGPLQRSLFRLRAKFSKNGGEESCLGAWPAGRAVLFDAEEAARNRVLELGRRVEQYYLA